jgi:hypothetical protein
VGGQDEATALRAPPKTAETGRFWRLRWPGLPSAPLRFADEPAEGSRCRELEQKRLGLFRPWAAQRAGEGTVSKPPVMEGRAC